jgi:uncharacterized membrane protein (DUF4010 family)
MTGTELAPLQLAPRLALALGLTVFLGLAFEEVYKREERSSPGGVRTFPMLALSGAMLYLIDTRNALPFTVGLMALAIWLHAFMRRENPAAPASLMVPASNLVAYLIGPIALMQPPWLAVTVTVCSVLLLSSREALHTLPRIVPPDELVTAGKFLILVGIILPLVPDERLLATIPLTPYHVWLAVVAICTLSYLGYLIQRYAPAGGATLLPAILGGLYSSTAATVVLSRRLRHQDAVRPELAAGILAATAVMYLRLLIVVAVFDRTLALGLLPAHLALFAASVVLAGYQWRRASHAAGPADLKIPAANPLQITTAVAFAAIFIVTSLLTAYIHTGFGEHGVMILAGLVGATDIDPFVVAIAQGGAAGLSRDGLSAAILIAAASNNLAKAAYCLGFGGFAHAARPAFLLLILALLGGLAAAAYLR